MSENNLFLIGDIPGLTPKIGRLVSMMRYARHTTLTAVAGLEVNELDYVHDGQSNSIGALISHKEGCPTAGTSCSSCKVGRTQAAFFSAPSTAGSRCG